MLRDNLQRVTPPLQLVLQLFDKEPITIRHNQNAADIFKYSAGVKYNLIVGRKTSCVRPTTATCNICFRQKLHCKLQGQIASCDMALTAFAAWL